ncbi:hypothetical protein BGZ65_008008 [Modicella reniformis]|uniref:Uncharacterized protein n=1 Tax=Modicella reniformis TaxID=1440133 RepID=A0A9P6IUI8_9FUNG|nr:hypothetical protein BGZ65_008008 [Modicella reniformis]
MSTGSPTNRTRTNLNWRQIHRQPHQEFMGSPNATSQSTVPSTVISPVSAGMESMTMNIEELGRIESLLTDDNDGSDAFGNNLLSLDMQLSSSHDSQLQLFGSLSGHGQKVSTCAFSQNGQWLASAGMDRKVLIWSVLDKELKCTIEGPDGHKGVITNARFCSDNRLILGTTSHDFTVRIWDLTPLAQGTSTTVSALQVLWAHKSPVTAVDFSPVIGSNHCVSCDSDGELRLWDFMRGDCERTIKMSVKQVFTTNPVRYHPQNPNIVAVGMGNSLYMVHINDPHQQPRPSSTTHSKIISTLDWSSQGNLLATASDDQVCVWDTTQSNQWRPLTTQQSPKIGGCAFLKSTVTGASGVTTRLVYGDYEKIWIWTFSGGNCMESAPVSNPQAHPGAVVTALACSITNVDGDNVVVLASASAGKDGNLKLWRVPG